MIYKEHGLTHQNAINAAFNTAKIEVTLYEAPINITTDVICTVDTTEHDEDVVLNLLKWLEDKDYLTHIVYDEDEDFDGNIVHFEREERLNVDEVLAEYEKESRNEK